MGLLALIAVNEDANDVMRVIDGCVWNRREIQVAMLECTVYLIKTLSKFRDPEDVTGGQLRHRAQFLLGKDSIVPETDLPHPILRPGVDGERDHKLMCSMLIVQLLG